MHKPMHHPASVENCTGHDHAVHQFRAGDVNLLQNDTPYAQAHEVRLLDAQMVDDQQNIFRDDVEVVAWEGGKDVLAVSVVA